MKKTILIIIPLLMLACSVPVLSGQPVAPTAILPNVIFVASPTPNIPTPTAPLPAPTVAEPESPPAATTEGRSEAGIPLPYNENIVINLVMWACDARWSNNLAYFSCPGDRSATDGAVISLEQPSFPNGMIIRNRTLLTVPGYGSNGAGIFGRYPAYTIESDKTHFMAGLTCLSFPCQADFGLGYYDQTGNYHDLITWKVDSARFSEEYGFWEDVDYDLSSFVGQTIELVLVVRNLPNQKVEALWIEPMIYLKY